MRLIAILLCGVATGFIGHKSDRVISSWRNTPSPWRMMARYVVGGILVIIMFIPLKMHIASRDQKELLDADIEALMLSFESVGIGVALGYITDAIRSRKK